MKVYFITFTPAHQSIYIRLESVFATFNDTPDFHVIRVEPYVCVLSDLIDYIIDEKNEEEGTILDMVVHSGVKDPGTLD